jgi:hypothetical protein
MVPDQMTKKNTILKRNKNAADPTPCIIRVEKTAHTRIVRRTSTIIIRRAGVLVDCTYFL